MRSNFWIKLSTVWVIGATSAWAAPSCEEVAISAVETKFKSDFFHQGRRVRRSGSSCEKKTSAKGSVYRECEVWAESLDETGEPDGGGTNTYVALLDAQCRRAFKTYLKFEE